MYPSRHASGSSTSGAGGPAASSRSTSASTRARAFQLAGTSIAQTRTPPVSLQERGAGAVDCDVGVCAIIGSSSGNAASSSLALRRYCCFTWKGKNALLKPEGSAA